MTQTITTREPALTELPVVLEHTKESDTLVITAVTGPACDDFQALHQAIDALWVRDDADRLRITAPAARDLPLHRAHWSDHGGDLEIERTAFYQIREAFLAPGLWPLMPLVDVPSSFPGGRHPRRPRIGDGTLYRKHLHTTGQRFELRRARLDLDGARFHEWQNDPRVAQAWEEDGPREKTDAYLSKRLADPHCEPLIGMVDGTPFAYIETYWAREDRLGPYYDVQDHDQGYHILVGDPAHLGAARTVGWLRAVNHYLFLLEPRTERVVGEPNVQNRRVIERGEQAGFRAVKEFDFPHKRALLLMCDRATFFTEGRI